MYNLELDACSALLESRSCVRRKFIATIEDNKGRSTIIFEMYLDLFYNSEEVWENSIAYFSQKWDPCLNTTITLQFREPLIDVLGDNFRSTGWSINHYGEMVEYSKGLKPITFKEWYSISEELINKFYPIIEKCVNEELNNVEDN